MGGDFQRHHPGKAQRGTGQGNGAHAAGAHIGNHQKGTEKNQGCTKVIHEGQAAADNHGIGDEANEVPLGKDSVHGGGPHKHEADLTQLRGLKGKGADNQPVFGAVDFFAQHQSDKQKANAANRCQPPELLRPLQVPQSPADAQKGTDTHDDGKKLLAGLLRHHGGNGRHAHGGDEKGDGLHLEGGSADAEVEQKQQPLHHHNAADAHQHRLHVLLTAEKKAQAAQHLEDGQQQHIDEAAAKAAGSAPELGQPLLLPLGDGLQGHLHPADFNHILRLQGPDGFAFAVDEQAAGGLGVPDGPAAVIVPGQDAVVPGDGGHIQHHITAFASADDVFPMGDGQLGAVCHGEPCPDFRCPAEKQQRLYRPEQNEKGQSRGHVAKHRQKHIVKRGLRSLQALYQILHTTPPVPPAAAAGRFPGHSREAHWGFPISWEVP